MKVILLKDVAKIGRKSEVKDVPDGHALNFLIPRGFAKPANIENLKQLGNMQQTHSDLAEKEKENFKATVSLLKEQTLELNVEANDKGHLFKGVHEQDIVDCLNEIPGASVLKKYVTLPAPIKSLGEYEIKLSCGDLQGIVVLQVVNK